MQIQLFICKSFQSHKPPSTTHDPTSSYSTSSHNLLKPKFLSPLLHVPSFFLIVTSIIVPSDRFPGPLEGCTFVQAFILGHDTRKSVHILFSVFMVRQILFQDVSVYQYTVLCFFVANASLLIPMNMLWKCIEFWSKTGLRSNYYLPLGHSDYKLLRSHSSEWSTLQYKEFDSSIPKSLPAGRWGGIRPRLLQIPKTNNVQQLFTCKDSPFETEAAPDRKEQSWHGQLAAISCVKNVKLNLQPSATFELSLHRQVLSSIYRVIPNLTAYAQVCREEAISKQWFMIVTDTQLLRVLASFEHQFSSKFE